MRTWASPPLPTFVIQLKEARAEWRRRHPKSFKPGQSILVKLSGGRIEEARINHVIQHPDGTKLQVDFGHDETALVELWQVLED